MDKPVMILGVGPLTLPVIEIFDLNRVVVFGILDDKQENEGKEFGHVAVLSNLSDDEYIKLIGKKCEAFISSDEPALRKGLVRTLKEKNKVMPVNAIHPSARTSSYCPIGHGNFIGAGADLSAGAEVGNHCIIQPTASVGPGSRLGDHVQLGQGVRIGADTIIEDGAFIGIGAVIVPGVRIGKGARVGAGSVVVDNVASGTTVFGNPAKKVQL